MPLAPTAGQFPGFCLGKPFPDKGSTFLFRGGAPRGGRGGGYEKIVMVFFHRTPWGSFGVHVVCMGKLHAARRAAGLYMGSFRVQGVRMGQL